MINNAFAAITEKTTKSFGVADLIWDSGPLIQMILLLLFVFSVISWAIIVYKFFFIKKNKDDISKFTVKFFECTSLDDMFAVANVYSTTPLSAIFVAGYQEMQKLAKKQTDFTSGLENIIRSMNKAHITQMTKVDEYISFLATTASAAPFIGLFGTVWGIMNSFRAIGMSGSANIATVAPGISEALITTAIGIGAAVPAVIAYNYFLSKSKKLNYEMKSFKADLLNIIKRNF